MAPPLFLHRLGNDFCLQPLFRVHLLQAPVLFFKFLEPCHHGGIHAAEPAAPFVKQRRTHAMFPAQFRYWRTAFCLLQYGDDLAFRKA